VVTGLIVVSCTSGKNGAGKSDVIFSDVRAAVYKAFPGVQGDVHHFVNIELRFNLSSDSEISIRSLEADGKTIPVKQLLIGQKLQATDNTLITGPAENIKIEAGYPVYIKEAGEEEVTNKVTAPSELVLVFEQNGKTRRYEINQIAQKNPVFYPAANPGPQNQR
jgi:hypothetical protein